MVSWWHSFTGVSNWGGYAIACALYILSTCEIHDRYLRKAVGFPQLSKKMVWLLALPSVTKVIPIGPRSCDLVVTHRRNWLPATKSYLVQFNSLFSHGLLVTSGNPWWTSSHCTSNIPQRIQDRLNIKNPQKWMYLCAATSSTRQCYNSGGSARNPCIAIQWLKFPVHFLSIVHNFINLCCSPL